MIDYLPQASLLRLLGVLGLVVAPHLPRLPLWAGVLVLSLGAWRATASLRQWRFPPGVLKAAMTLTAGTAVYLSYGRLNGQDPGVALLVVMLALKLTEMRARRDVMVVVFLMYFLLVTHFLYSQEIWTVGYLLISLLAITSVLIDVHHPGQALPARTLLRLSARMLLHAAPVAVLFFVLFPRVPGPLWGLPADSGAARSGLSESMSPGDIASLIESGDVAFRVNFRQASPAPALMYWRGPVFWSFDGRTWTPGFHAARVRMQDAISETGGSLSYAVTLEPMRSHWMLALDLPDATALPPNAHLSADWQLLSPKPLRERVRYELASHTRYRLAHDLSERDRANGTRLPRGFDPRARELAQSWRERYANDGEIVQAALRMFRQEAFVYTLRPPRLGRHTIDDFLFGTRRGFCEHYASAFTVLMRAAGVPARIVTGYQGGELNALGNYWTVRQSDAHAWSEVWLPQRGWTRIDPTAAVAPERVERGLRDALSEAEGLPSFLRRGNWRLALEANWDWINAQWNALFLAYGPELQRDFLQRIGLDDLRNMILALTFSVSAVLAAIGFLSLRRSAAPAARDKAQRLWDEVRKRLRPSGLRQGASEGPQDFAQRVIAAQPSLEAPMRIALDAYLRLRYLGEFDTRLERALSEASKRLR